MKPENVNIEQSEMKDESGEVVLNWSAKKGKRIIGYVDLSTPLEKAHKPVWIMSSLWVHYSYRKVGIGKRMVKEMLGYLEKTDSGEVGLYVLTLNIPAINLYKSFGFGIAGDNHNCGFTPLEIEHQNCSLSYLMTEFLTGFREHIYLRKGIST